MTINELKRERRKAFNALKRALKAMDTALEVNERFIARVLARSNKIPDEYDLLRVVDQTRVMDTAFKDFMSVLEVIEVVFT